MSGKNSSRPDPATAEPAIPDASIEEIIASISRIIAEDNRTRAAAPGSMVKSGILELTEMIEPDGTTRRLPAGGAFAGRVAELAPAPANTGASTDAPGPETAGARGILSAAAAATTAAAFARLATAVRERKTASDLALGERGRTLEDIVREALHPLLQAWLDERLPAIVERLVREEIERVAGQTGIG